MSSQASASADSRSFDLLHEKIRKWIWREGWTELRDAQERAVPALIEADRDTIIAAQTAAGKTEVAFLPILSNLLRESPCSGSVLYVSPLKALINDQWSRLDNLCEELDIPVVGWHGDVSSSRKRQFFKNPTGVLLITPESLEAMFVNRGSSIEATFAFLRYVVVDELHAFIGSERGKQLQSLMYRVQRACGRTVPRVGLSATLGDMQLAARFLRPGGASAVEIIESKSTSQELKVVVKGFVNRPPRVELEPELDNPELEDAVSGGIVDVANQLYRSLRGSNNLIFPNSRRQVETYADLLRRACERDGYPNEFWPHHGSLSKELREDTERALKEGDRPASAVCTTTLELGIDIGSVKSIAQIGAPPSVASLRQRLGRSGRRKGEPSILRGYCIESELTPQSDFSDRIREGLVQSVAMVHLLMRKWFEPPRIGGLHASTLIQQILSIIAERGGCTAGYLWSSLVASGTFDAFDKATFTEILLHLGTIDLIVQSSNGLLLHGEAGEKLANHYEFYSAFATDEEFRLVAKGRQLGSLPVAHPLTIGQGLIFAGRRWRVQEVDQDSKTIYVLPDHGGAPPQFDGNSAMVHDEVRREMRRVLASDEPELMLDIRGRELLQEARRYYADASLASAMFVPEGAAVHIVTWCGDWVNDALALLLKACKLDAFNGGVVVSVTNAGVDRLVDVLGEIGGWDGKTVLNSLGKIENLEQEKWDWALPEDVRRRAFASTHLDIEGALSFARAAGGAVRRENGSESCKN
ncbi:MULTISPECIES: DEAD/DEAH box helicase [Burkholderia]|uniref:DEAD/DEAH box helicase n=1 Tax=Burkholderia TaxID=32008 RepID=UPI00064F7345|nr:MULTISPECIES: DEAD/DEAH box helicase [Burkholderia]KML07957.1 DEAD/DEAH box helicase [Burkholderia cepacia]KMN62610.1 DEAD/DEAH box helicase [Burkholderia sp. LK4]